MIIDFTRGIFAKRWEDDNVVFTGVQAAISLVGQSGSSERQTRLKGDIS